MPDFTLNDVQVNDEDNFDLGELLKEASEEVIKNRKSQLSNKINQLFKAIDDLAQQERRQKADLKKTQDRLAKKLELANRLKTGDWEAVRKLNGDDNGQ